jgi:hypothetical protein
MNINKALDKKYESMSLTQILDAPVDALAGVSKGDAEKLQASFGIRTIRDLATNQYFLIAQGILALEQAEENTQSATA